LNGAAVEARGRLLRSVIERFLSAEAIQVQARGPSGAEAAAGQYLSTRRPHVGPTSMFEVLGTVTVSAEKDGSLATSLEGSEHRWLPDGQDRFRHSITGIPLALTRDGNGRVVRLASSLLNNVAEFERAPLKVRLALPILATALIVLIGIGIIRLWPSLFRRRGRPNGRAPLAPWTVPGLAAAAPWLLVGTLLAWPAALVLGLAGSAPISAALNLLSLLAVAGAAALIVQSIAIVRSPASSRRSRFVQALAAFSGLGAAYLIIAFGLTGF
jgi:hypothetical protein